MIFSTSCISVICLRFYLHFTDKTEKTIAANVNGIEHKCKWNWNRNWMQFGEPAQPGQQIEESEYDEEVEEDEGIS